MKTLLIAMLGVGALGLFSGCATPAYTGGLPTIRLPEEKLTGENMNNILRAWVLDNREMIEDINSALLVDSPSQLTKWHIR